MITLKDDDLLQFESDLKTFGKRAYPFATKGTINDTAFTAQRFARQNVRDGLITRNTFTKRSIQVHKSSRLNVNTQSAYVGSTEDYMERQEFGGTVRDPVDSLEVPLLRAQKCVIHPFHGK